ncbi:MAG: PqqD family peptide modification chaperone [Theionarchaea archaeon]|nr:PqqD family peptide modification chaperone [Theionarchaea archaeon]
MIELLFPPQWIPTQPYLGLACLTGYLRKKGLKVHQTDVNVLFYNHILSKSFLEYCRDITERKFEKLEKKGTINKEHSELIALYILSDDIVDLIEEAKQNFKSEKSLDLQEYLFNLKVLQHALRLVSVCHHPLSLSLSNLKMQYNHRSTTEIFSAVSDPGNFFLPFYSNIVTQILRRKPSVCGISITGVNQIIPGLTLARIIKKRDPSIFVVLGGSIVTRWKECPGLKKVFDVCDCLVFKEGEKAVAALAAENIEKVPNVGYTKNGKIIFNHTEVITDLDELPTPCFKDVDLGLYLSPRPVLPVYASRACYWGRCAFCDHGYGYNKEYRTRSPERVVEDLCDLMQYNTTYFSFADEAIPPTYFKKFCNSVIESGLDITWFAHVRAEKGFTKNLCKKMYESGCRMLLFGIESGCQKVLDLIDKGTKIEDIVTVLRRCRDAGLWNHAFLFFGFPGERKEDAEETVQFVCENKEVINSVGCTTFLLGKYSRVCREKGTIKIYQKKEDDMAIWYDYSVKKGITSEEASKMRENLQEKLHHIYPNQGILESICREHVLQLIDAGCDFSIKENILHISSDFTPHLSRSAGLKKVHHDFIPFIEGVTDRINPRTAYLVYDLQKDTLMEISETAFHVLQSCTRDNSVGEIAHNLSEHHSMDFETVLKDVATFLNEMVSKGIIN